MSEPTPFHGKNQVSAFENADFVNDCIAELVSCGWVRELETAPGICSPLSVVQNSVGKMRLVINLRHLNMFLYKQRFKYEDLRVAMLMLKKCGYMLSFDLKSGYHHIDIAVEVNHKYLGFAWRQGYYVFAVLPFELCTTCYLFTKVVRPLVRYWRAQGLRVVLQLDDGLGVASGMEAACAGSELVHSTLDSAGFVAHLSKLVWKPTQCLIWLSFVINLAEGQIQVPDSKIESLLGMLPKAKQSASVRARYLASLLGKIISMSLAFGPVTRFMTRSLYSVLGSR